MMSFYKERVSDYKNFIFAFKIYKETRFSSTVLILKIVFKILILNTEALKL